MKTCSRCKRELPLENFLLRNEKHYRPNTRRSACQDCINNTRRNLKYKITTKFVSDKIIQQNNACAICKASFIFTKPVLDHCHSTKRVRDFLCTGCNTALGVIEKTWFVSASQKYLQHHKKQHLKEELGELY